MVILSVYFSGSGGPWPHWPPRSTSANTLKCMIDISTSTKQEAIILISQGVKLAPETMHEILNTSFM